MAVDSSPQADFLNLSMSAIGLAVNVDEVRTAPPMEVADGIHRIVGVKGHD